MTDKYEKELSFDMNPSEGRVRSKALIVAALEMCDDENISEDEIFETLMDEVVRGVAAGFVDDDRDDGWVDEGIKELTDLMAKAVKTVVRAMRDEKESETNKEEENNDQKN